MKTTKLKAKTNGSRHANLLQKNLLIKNDKIFKNLRININKNCGRSPQTGHITSWHKQTGKKRLYRNINHLDNNSQTIILGMSYDPNRNSFTSINFDLNKKKFITDTAIKATYTGTLIEKTNENCELKQGYRSELKNIPAGSLITNISNQYSNSGKYVKSAGTVAQLLQKDNKTAKIRLPSKKVIQLPIKSLATIGVISNEIFNKIVIGKAGRNRNLGRRPIVRGIAMNPVDHPHGGRTNGGRPSVTPWGLPTKCKFKLKRRKK